MSVAGTLTGHYSPNAVDDAGQTIPAAITAVGGNLVVAVTPPAGSTYPITVAPTFEATNPSSSTVQELYPEPEAPVDPEDEPMTPEDVVEIVDDARQELISDLKNPDDSLSDDGIAAASGQVTTASSAPKKVKVPHWTYNTYSIVRPKYYIYDPHNKNHRNPERNGWHDYCTSSNDEMGGARGTIKISFRGPCARHDLCIQWKQAPSRWYCDDKLKADIRQNCRYYLRNVTGSASGTQLLANCYGAANTYHYWVRWQTGHKTDAGHWEHSLYTSVYPTYRYDDWTQ